MSKLKKMKTKLSMLVFLLLLNSIYSQNFLDKTNILLQSLTQNEFFNWEYDAKEKKLSIYSINNKNKYFYDSIDYLRWGDWQVSKDRRKIIYWENWSNNDNPEYSYFYLLDGNTGRTYFLGNLHEGYTSADFKYLIYKDSSVSPKVKLIIYNLEKKKIEKEIIWRIKAEKYFDLEENSIYILRSKLPNYDFHIYIVGAEDFIFSEGYLNIQKGIIDTVYDDETEERIFDISNFSQFEFGE